MELSLILFALVALAGVAGVSTRGKKVLKKRRAQIEVRQDDNRQAEEDKVELAIKESIEEIKKI